MGISMPEFRPVQVASGLWASAAGGGSRRGRHSAAEPASEPGAPPGDGNAQIRCTHCDVPIRQWWVHVGPAGTFQCRDGYGLLLDDQYAEPAYPTGVVAGIRFRPGGDVA